MIYGIGVDIVSLTRIQKAWQQPKFAQRLLNDVEWQDYRQLSTEKRQVEFLAGRWAAKEAYAKALGTGIGANCRFHDITIRYSEKKQPQIESPHFEGQAFLSISHSEDYAVAQVVLEQC